MSSYISYTQEERDQAHHTDLTALLRSQGEALKRSGTEYEWHVGGQKVTIRGHLWYHQYEQVGGDAVGFVCRFYGKSYPDAVQFLLSQERCSCRRFFSVWIMTAQVRAPLGAYRKK